MPPMTLMIKPVSSRCNMRCKYCFYCDEAARRSVPDYGVMALQTLENAIRRAMAYADGSLSILYQGGEPTLAGVEFYRQGLALERRYNARGLRVHHAIQTNGMDVPQPLLELLIEAGFLFGVSLDGPQETHDPCRVDGAGRGTWARAKATLDRIVALGGEANVLCVVTNQIAHHTRSVWEALAPYGYIQFIACMDGLDGQGGDDFLSPDAYGDFLCESFDLYEKAIRKGRLLSVRQFDNYVRILSGGRPDSCAMEGACNPYFLVEADGSVFPCDFYAMDEYRLGNVNETPFVRLAKSEVASAFRQSSLEKPAKCMECQWFSLCKGGCRRDRLVLPNGELGESRWCESYQRFFARCHSRLSALAAQLMRTPPR